ncbi:MAG: rhomboid family intramembrane serine protease [Deltaproteobacteria bacterium]|nr:rhomboid family intramembrane serine protease [Deltaproteobacteria bacterium]
MALYLAMEAWGGSENPLVLTIFGAKERSLVVTGELWRLLSATFLHADILHLLMNGLAIFYLGRTCENIYGARRFIVLYFASAVGGSIASTIATPHIGVGASGATFGLIAAMLVFAVRARDMMPEHSRRALFWFFLPWLALSIWLGFATPLIDGWAHLGGALTGLALAVAYVRGRNNESLLHIAADDTRHAWAARATALIALIVAGFTVHSVIEGDEPVLKGEVEVKRFEIEGFEVSIPKAWSSAGGRALITLEPVFRDPRGLLVRLAAVATTVRPEARLDLLLGTEPSNIAQKANAVRHAIPVAFDSQRVAIGRSIDQTTKEGSLFRSLVFVPLEDRLIEVVVESASSSRSYHLKVLERLVASVKPVEPPAATEEERATRWIKLVRSRMELARIVSEDDVLASYPMSEALDLLESAYVGMRRSKHVEPLLTELYKTLVTAWEKELSATKDPTADRLNRLAWVYATAEISTYRNAKRAVELASRAVEKSNGRLAPIIDTLAAAYHANDEREKALSTIERALEKEPGHRYYTDQKKKFEKGGADSFLK